MPSAKISPSWLSRPRPHPDARLRLFCFPYAGAGASAFAGWPELLPPEVELCAIQLPGREGRMLEPPFTRVATLLPALAHGLRDYLRPPFAFFGHSMGALISFEFARYLRRVGAAEPERLVVSGFRAPQLPDPDPQIAQLPDDEFVAEIRRFNGTPEEVFQHAELLQLLLPTLRADLTLCETYRYVQEAPLAYPIAAAGGLSDHRALREALAPWREQTQETFTLRMFPGDHFFIHTQRTELLHFISSTLQPLLNTRLT